MPERHAPLVAALLLAAALAGCATEERQRTHAALDIAPVADWAEAKADPLLVGENNVEIDSSARSFEFETGKSFYRILALPAGPRPLRIQVASIHAKGDRGFFQPDFLLLDRNRKVVRHIEAPLKGREPVQLPPFRYVLPGEIAISETAQDSAYLLVRTTSELLKLDALIRGVPFAPGSTLTYTIPSHSAIPAWPTGTLWIDIAALNPGR